MKILYLSDHGPYKTTFIRQDVEKISDLHNTLYIAFETESDYTNKKIKTLLIKYPSYSIKSKIRWRFENLFNYFNWSDKKFSLALNQEINNFSPDIIHCQFAYESAKLLHNFKTDLPIVINFRGYGASYKLKNKSYVTWLSQTLRQKNIYPIFVSQSLSHNLKEKKIIPLNKGIILYSGIDTEKFVRKNYIKNNIASFIQVSNFNSKKGQKITIKAFKKATTNNPKFNARLIFVGNGKYFNDCKKIVETLKLNSKVLFLGNLNQSEIINQMENATVFVHHSITAPNGDQEGIPNSIIEAMAMELPILSTFHSGIPEAVEHNVNGLLCEENDVETYSKQMFEISKWGLLKINRNKVLNKFNINSHIKKLSNYYQEILNEN